MRSAQSRKFPQRFLWKGATDTSQWQWPSLVLSTKIAQCFVFLRPSPPGDRWCDAPGVVPAGSAPVSSTLQIFRDRSHMWSLLFFPRTLGSDMPWTAHPQDSSEAEQDHSGLFIPLSTIFSFLFFFQTSSLNLWWRWHAWSDSYLSR